MAVDHILHPALKFGSDQVFDINLVELFGIDFILVCHLHLWISYLNQISLHRKWLGVLSQIFLLVENGVHSNKFGSILQLHELILDNLQLLLQGLNCEHVITCGMVKRLLSQLFLDRIKERLILFEVDVAQIEFVLLVPQSSFLEDFGNLVDELIWVVSVFTDLFLHVTSEFDPFVQFNVLRVHEVGHKRLDGNVEGAQMNLAKSIVSIKTSSQIGNVLVEQMILLIILHRTVFDDLSLDRVLAVEGQLLPHLENTWLDLLLGIKSPDAFIFVFAAQIVDALVDYLSCRVGISLLTDVLVFALTRNKTMGFFGLISALLLPDFGQSIVPIFNIHWILRHTVVFLLLLRTASDHQIIFYSILHVEQLFSKQVMIHKVLDCDLVPIVEKCTHIFRYLLPVKSFDKGKMLRVLNAIFQSRHGDDHFVFCVVDGKQMSFYLMDDLVQLHS